MTKFLNNERTASLLITKLILFHISSLYCTNCKEKKLNSLIKFMVMGYLNNRTGKQNNNRIIGEDEVG